MPNFSTAITDKIIALIVASLSVGAYLFTVYLGKPDEFLKNIALLFAGVLAGLLRGEGQIVSNPKGDTNITTSSTAKKDGK